MPIVIFWIVTTYGLVGGYQRFAGTLKMRAIMIFPNGGNQTTCRTTRHQTQITSVDIFTAMTISNLTTYNRFDLQYQSVVSEINVEDFRFDASVLGLSPDLIKNV
jgi:hypothetical protein